MNTRIDKIISSYFELVMEKDDLSRDDVDKLFESVRIEFNLDEVFLFENCGGMRKFKITHSAYRGNKSMLGYEVDFSHAELAKQLAMFDEESVYTYSIGQNSKYPMDSAALFGMIIDNTYYGAVGFKIYGNHVWSDEERESVKKLGRTIRLYIDAKNRRSIHEVNYQKYVDALTKTSISSYYIDLFKNKYVVLKIVDRLKEIIAADGEYDYIINHYANVCLDEQYRKEMINKFSRENLSLSLSEENLTVDMDFKRVISGKTYWFRQTATLVDTTEDGTPHHVIITVKDITNTVEEGENLRIAINMMKDSYYRICAMDLLSNEIFDIKCIDEEIEERIAYNNNLDEALNMVINYHIHPEDKEKLSSILCVSYLRSVFVDNREGIDFTYKRCIKGEYTWVRSEIIPVENYGPGNAKVIWYVKNISEEVAKETALTAKIIEYNAELFKTKEALEVAYESANNANNAKTDFLSRMSHDIRTPMNAIIGMTAIAGAHIDDKEKVQSCLEKIGISSRHLLSLINEVLDMSKIESGNISLSEEEFNMASLIDNLIEMSKTGIKQKKHHLNVILNKMEHEDVIGDSLRIQQAFMNIMSNAIKYTPEGGNIDITISEKHLENDNVCCYEFVFEDNGIGMTEEYMEHLFEPFTRAVDDRVNKIQGTGLGMAITQNVVHMMNGDIQVESAPGKGTKFTITIFLKNNSKECDNIEELRGYKVLIVDDDISNCKNASEVFENIGMISEWALDAKEAVDKVIKAHENNKDYYVLIIEHNISGYNGIDIVKEIRANNGGDIPVIILASYEWADVELEARAAGVDDFITKPLFRSRLIAAMKKLVSGISDNMHENPLNSIYNKEFINKKVLLVDDDEFNREISYEILNIMGFDIDIAENGRDAVEKFAESENGYYKMIFMDVQMPIMNGYEATAAIRSLERRDAKGIPIVAMTANAFVEDVQAAMSAGMNEHLAKPLDIKRMQEIIHKWM